MDTLQQLAQQQPEFALDRFVEVVNQLLPQFLPEAVGSRGQESVNPRLVRHYTTQRLLDKPLKQGREVRYTYRHLLQLLVLRRLLAEGYSVSSMHQLIGGQPNATLENLLQGGAQLTVETANPALAFLAQVRDRSAPPTAQRAAPAPAPAANSRAAAKSRPQSFGAASPAPPSTSNWTRLELLDGLELHVRDTFALPASAHERERLLQLIAQSLTQLNSSRRHPP
ncbi:MerR family transcriptional regulator [Leptolyngbya iicbica]|uniref:MerR family transcriptional regulator n=2 Tax=Cyanophyceae TaxID=3028117 RepID=A0A4Q7EH47_9CYAN|nr:MerR family transcriptional regulator [Leptolyngbya sp. LK]RZM82643.1 MerR family transcriptional regulator [Leptolyngbya sp. LK]